MTYILLFVLGTILASFLNALMYRLDKEVQMPEMLVGRSKCENCGKELTWYELFPIFGYFIAGGKCQKCGEDINWYYPLSELVLGVFLVALYYLGASPFEYLAVLVLFSLSYFDVTSKSIPAFLAYILIGIGVAYAGYQSWQMGHIVLNSGLTAAIVISILTLILNQFKKSFGFGDILVFIGLSFFLDGMEMIALYFLSAIVAVLLLLPLIVLDRTWLKKYVPFVPFITLAFVLTLLLSPTLIPWFTTHYLLW